MNCGPPALVRVGGHIMSLGSCAGNLFLPAPKVRVHVGQEIDVHVTEEGTGPAGNQLVPLFPVPRSSRPSVLLPGAVGPDQATERYQAIRPGHAALIAQTSCTAISHGKILDVAGSCPLIEVTVVP